MTAKELRGAAYCNPISEVVENDDGSSTTNQQYITAINTSRSRVGVGFGSEMGSFQMIITCFVGWILHLVC
jgi:hypothetical protein